jgi:2-dehydropantoate 2-reductase
MPVLRTNRWSLRGCRLRLTTPHIAIVGAGSVGCYIGGRLREHARVTFIGRPRMAAEVSSYGLTLSDWKGYRRHIEPACVEFDTNIAAAAAADLALVTVKSGSTEAVARELAAILPRTALVASLQNGLKNPAILREYLPAANVLAAMVPFNVVHRSEGVFHQGSSGALMIQADARLAPYLAVFQDAGLPLIQRPDIEAVQQGKLLLNLNNVINALANLPLREQLSQRPWRRCLALAQAEALRVFEAAGIHPARLTPLPPDRVPAVLRLPDFWFRLLARRMLAIDPLARSSTWEDLQAGRETEVDAIQGEIIALGKEHRCATPVNAALLELIRAAEIQRVPISGPQLLEILKAADQGVGKAAMRI